MQEAVDHVGGPLPLDKNHLAMVLLFVHARCLLDSLGWITLMRNKNYRQPRMLLIMSVQNVNLESKILFLKIKSTYFSCPQR